VVLLIQLTTEAIDTQSACTFNNEKALSCIQMKALILCTNERPDPAYKQNNLSCSLLSFAPTNP
jgi:hypothetical protein